MGSRAIAHLPFRPNLDDVLGWIEYAYLMRFQILAATILAVGLPLGYSVIPSLFEGLFDGRGFRSLAFTVWAAFQLAWTIMATCRLVLVYGPDRFGRAQRIQVQPVRSRIVASFGLLAVPLVATVCWGTEQLGWISKTAAVVVGLAAALFVLAMTAALHFAIEGERGSTANAVFPSFGFLDASGLRVRKSSFWTMVDSRLSKWPPDLTAGIVKDGRLRSGHEMATIALGVLLLLYVLTGVAFSPLWTSPERQPAALFFLLFLLTVLTWLLSGAAFFLDRFRLPVFTTLLFISLLTGFFRTDHQFAITKRGANADERLTPEQVVWSWAHEPRIGRGKTVTIVATAGGGIRASAWTAEVMTRLQENCGQNFSSSIVLMSSVSGGSVGAMFVMAPYSPTNGAYPTDSAELEAIRFNSSRSSLSAVGWGLSYPDLARTMPVFGSLLVPQTLDRGWALENAWLAGWKERPKMSDWRQDVGHGRRPAVIFNATASENGERFLIASTETNGDSTVRFFDAFPGWDVPVVTAARLSATFPYASPLARPSDGPESNRFHVADGGYYDNSGVLSAVEWLREAKDALHDYTVLLIVIDAEPGPNKDGKSWSWQHQLVGPIETVLHVRTSSQALRDRLERDMAMDYLKLVKGAEGEVTSATFLYSSDLPVPLSWHLTKAQRDTIPKAWSNPRNNPSRSAVYRQLGCPMDESERH
jgi:hypothetical protein